MDFCDAKSSVPQLYTPSEVSVATLKGHNFLFSLKDRVLSGRNGSRSGERRREGRMSRSVSSEDECRGREALAV